MSSFLRTHLARMEGPGPRSGSPAHRATTYNYAEWKGKFYPDRFAAKRMLPLYAQRLTTVEINYTFYRMPTARLLGGRSEWRQEHLRFALKARRRITHEARLRKSGDTTAAFCGVTLTRGPKLGVLLFQLPPSFETAPAVLDDFLATLPRGVRAALGFVMPRGTTRRFSNGSDAARAHCVSPTVGG